MENTMIERVSEAIGETLEAAYIGGGEYAFTEDKLALIACAAIEAMRDRDQAMLDAGTAVLWPHVQKLAPGSTAVAVYEAMIDAALGRVDA